MKLIDIIDGTPIRFAYRIAFLTNFYREPVLREIEQRYGLIRPEWTVLICMKFRDGLNARDICEITEQPSNTVSRAVASLEERALITTTADPDDGRRRLLHLTDEGEVMHEAAMAVCVAAEEKMMAVLTDDERATLDRLLDKLARDVPNWVR